MTPAICSWTSATSSCRTSRAARSGWNTTADRSGSPTGSPRGEQLPHDDLLLDNAPETHRAIPYYAAAHLLLHEDAFAYATLMNEWQTQLLSLYRLPQPSRSVVTDAYQWEALHV